MTSLPTDTDTDTAVDTVVDTLAEATPSAPAAIPAGIPAEMTAAAEPMPDAPSVWDTVYQKLSVFSKPYPRETIALAHAHREEIAPRLVEVLQEVAADPQQWIKAHDDDVLNSYAMLLLACWSDTRAYPALASLGHLDEDTLEMIIGDLVTESYGRSLASVCDGDLQPIKAVFEDVNASHWARLSALDALVVRVMEGDLDRQPVLDYLLEQGEAQARRLYNPAEPLSEYEVIDGIVQAAADLAASELRERVLQWYDEDLLDTTMLPRKEFEADVGRSFEAARQLFLEAGRGYVRDVEPEVSWWNGFYEPTSSPAFEPLPDGSSSRHVWPSEPLPPVQTVVRSSPKIGRNDPCPCGSGKKYKKCCGAN